MKKESVINAVLIVLVGVLAVVGSVKAATTISTDIVTGGSLSVTGTSSLMGNVGIGTPAAGAKLDVRSSSSNLLNLMSSSSFAQLQTTSYRNSATTHNLIEGLAARGTQVSPSAVQAGDALFSIRAGGYGTTDFDSNIKDDSSAIDFQADGTFSDSAGIPYHPGRIVLKTAEDVGFLVERMRIDSIGRVGIGVTSPTATLEIATSTSNATTTLKVGKAGQNKGSCLALYDVTGAAVYVTVQGGALVVSTASCQ